MIAGSAIDDDIREKEIIDETARFFFSRIYHLAGTIDSIRLWEEG